MLEKSYIFGPLILITAFFVILILTLGIKTLIYYVKQYFMVVETPKKQKPKRKRNIQPKQPSAIRSIEINPEEIDRIYVKR